MDTYTLEFVTDAKQLSKILKARSQAKEVVLGYAETQDHFVPLKFWENGAPNVLTVSAKEMQIIMALMPGALHWAAEFGSVIMTAKEGDIKI